MREQAERLRLTLQEDGGGAEMALKKVLKSELLTVFAEFMDVDDIIIDVAKSEINVKVTGGGLRKVGFYAAE